MRSERAAREQIKNPRGDMKKAQKSEKPKRRLLRRAPQAPVAPVADTTASDDHANDLQEPECPQAQRAHDRLKIAESDINQAHRRLDAARSDFLMMLREERIARMSALKWLAAGATMVAIMFLITLMVAARHANDANAKADAAVAAAQADHAELAAAMRRADAAARVAKANAQALDAMRKSMRDTSRLAICANDALENPCGAVR